MFLGQPETAAEREAEERQAQDRADARERRNARAVAEYRHLVAGGMDENAASTRVAQVYKMGRGGARYVRSLDGQAA